MTYCEGKRERLIAPCGVDCGVCSAYLAYTNHIPRRRGAISHCSGCRIRKKKCAYLKGHCRRLASDEVEFCFQCAEYPCVRLKHLDGRYRKGFGASPISNLEIIRESGIQELIDRQQSRFGCAACGRLRSVHNQKCFFCEKISSWRT
jgi:hypothetical protein